MLSRAVRLLDADPDLGAGSTADVLAEAAQLVVPVASLPVGDWRVDALAEVPGVHGQIRGFLVLSGALAQAVSILERRCTRLIGPRQLVLLHGLDRDPTASESWSTLEPCRLAILDDRLLLIGRRWPSVMGAILERAAQDARHAQLQQAIGQLPRVEDRLLVLLWSFADRMGAPRGDGVWLRLGITHAVLAHMVGASRPMVRLCLQALERRGAVRSRPDGWLLDPQSRREIDGGG